MEQKKPTNKQIERKYRRLNRQTKWKKIITRLPFFIGACCVILVTVWLILRLRHPVESPADGSLQVYVVDVGQGASVLLCSEQSYALLDGGDLNQIGTLRDLLHRLRIQRLDYVINTHPHADHMGTLPAILREYPVGELLLADIPDALLPTTQLYLDMLDAAAEQNIPTHVVKNHDTRTLGNASLLFLTNDNTRFEDLNNCSLGCYVSLGTRRLFFGGDIETKAESAFLDAGAILPADFYFVSHHGSNSSSSTDFLAALQPKIAAISCGSGNDYGHPAPHCLERLNSIGCTVYRTDLDGTLLLSVDANGIHMETGF